jgi:hypothetical protein
MAYEDYHVNADDVKLDGDPNIRRTVPPSPSGSGGLFIDSYGYISIDYDYVTDRRVNNGN